MASDGDRSGKRRLVRKGPAPRTSAPAEQKTARAVSLEVNGTSYVRELDLRTTLLDALRDKSDWLQYLAQPPFGAAHDVGFND